MAVDIGGWTYRGFVQIPGPVDGRFGFLLLPDIIQKRAAFSFLKSDGAPLDRFQAGWIAQRDTSVYRCWLGQVLAPGLAWVIVAPSPLDPTGGYYAEFRPHKRLDFPIGVNIFVEP